MHPNVPPQKKAHAAETHKSQPQHGSTQPRTLPEVEKPPVIRAQNPDGQGMGSSEQMAVRSSGVVRSFGWTEVFARVVGDGQPDHITSHLSAGSFLSGVVLD